MGCSTECLSTVNYTLTPTDSSHYSAPSVVCIELHHKMCERLRFIRHCRRSDRSNNQNISQTPTLQRCKAAVQQLDIYKEGHYVQFYLTNPVGATPNHVMIKKRLNTGLRTVFHCPFYLNISSVLQHLTTR